MTMRLTGARRIGIRLCSGVTALFCLLALAGGARAEESLVLARTYYSSEQRIPLILNRPATGKVSAEWVKLSYKPVDGADAASDSSLFLFEKAKEKTAQVNSFHAQFWASALLTARLMQQPWAAVKWTVTELPSGDAVSCGAALGVGLIATATGTSYPADTVILGPLYPDGSLGAVDRLSEQIQAAAAAGMTRVIIPNLQRFEKTGATDLRDITEFARRLGVECVVADTLADATELALHRKLPASPRADFTPRYAPALSSALDEKCLNLVSYLSKQSTWWPRSEEKLNALSAVERALWKRVFAFYDLGMESYQSGRMYAAYRLLRLADGNLAGLLSVGAGTPFDFKAYDQRATAVRQQMVERLKNSPIDQDELQSATVLAEESDWLQLAAASVEGAQTVARQAFAPRSEASPEQKRGAQVLLISAVASAERQMRDPNFFEENYSLLVAGEKLPTYDRATGWLPPLRLIQLGAAESFITGLRVRATDLGDKLLFDARLANLEKGLQPYRAAWEWQQQEAELAARALESSRIAIGFTPGESYSPPRRAQPAAVAEKLLSDTALGMIWANDYGELAILNEKYRRLGATFNSNLMEWQVKDSGTLQNMLLIADLSAREGIALAQSVGLDTSTLSMIYETAATLRTSGDNDLKLEGLRQYWRCALLGNIAWQCGYIPRAIGSSPENVLALAAATAPVRLLPTPSPILVRSTATTMP